MKPVNGVMCNLWRKKNQTQFKCWLKRNIDWHSWSAPFYFQALFWYLRRNIRYTQHWCEWGENNVENRQSGWLWRCVLRPEIDRCISPLTWLLKADLCTWTCDGQPLRPGYWSGNCTPLGSFKRTKRCHPSCEYRGADSAGSSVRPTQSSCVGVVYSEHLF